MRRHCRPRAEDGADDVLVELHGEDCVEFVAGAQREQIEPNGVREGTWPWSRYFSGAPMAASAAVAGAVV